MESWLLKHWALLYQVVMVAAFLTIATWETLRPRTNLVLSTARRWLMHGCFLVITRAAIWLVFPAGAVALSLGVAGNRYGLLNRELLPFPVRFILTLLMLDLVLYFMHYTLHKVPLLWRLHKTHHSDRDYDLTTAIRFHPLESMYVQGGVLLAILLCAPPVSAVICFELADLVQTFLGHSNIKLPARIDRAIRLVQVTPELHRVHHSMDVSDQNTNFGFVFTLWDRLFGTLRNESRVGTPDFELGLQEVSGTQSIRFWEMLALPLRTTPGPPSESVRAAAPSSIV